MLYRHWKDYPAALWRWPNFSPQEMACRGTGKLMVDEAAMDRLQALRDALGAPLIITSAYRSPEHNAAVGGAPNSLHKRAIAFDVSMQNHEPNAFIAAARRAGFTGIGTYPGRRGNFVHIDTGPARSWGDPFPERPATPKFAPEPVREPERVREDGEAKGALAGIGGAVAASGGVLASLGSLDPIAQVIAVGGLLLALLALGYIFRRRLKRMAA